MMVKNRLFVTDLPISTDKSKFDELIKSGKIENYKIMNDVHFFDNKSLLLLVTRSPLI
jgi:hypothetical protein